MAASVLPRRNGNGGIASGVFLCVIEVVASPVGCQMPRVDQRSGEPGKVAAPHPSPEGITHAGVRPRAVSIEVDQTDHDQWLFVEKVRGKAAGGWATGSFDRNRNKLVISTKDVAGFALYIERIPIDWERLVVLRIDGVNTELRRRDSAVYHFEVDEHGRWIVVEP